MGVNNSSWSVNIPSGTSSIRHGDDQIRSDKSIIQALIDSEHYFTLDSASSASGGVHRLGSARIFFGARTALAAPNSADSSGRLYYAADHDALLFLNTSSISTIVYGKGPVGSRYSRVWGIASGSYSAVTFAGIDYDVGSLASSNTGAFTTHSASSGRYMLTANIQFTESVRSGTQRAVRIRKNGTAILGGQSSSTGTSAGNPIELSVAVVDTSTASTDYYECLLFHDAGVSLTSLQVTGYFTIDKL